MQNSNLLKLSINDLFSIKMMQYSLAPLIISMGILYLLFFLFAGATLDQLSTLNIQSTQTTLENGIPHTEHISANLEGWTAILEFLMEYTLTSWLASFFIYILGGFFTLYISIFIAIIVVGFLTPLVLKELQQRHYQDIEMIGYGSIIESIFVIMKSSSVMVMLFFLLIPLYFIPIINIIAINFPLYYFFHKMITFDIASTICTREESKKIKYFNANMLRAKTLFLYITSLIPFTVFFTTIFFVIYLGNTYFVEIKKLRTES